MTYGAIAAVLAVGVATAVVLREVMAYDPPRAREPEPVAVPPPPAPLPEPVAGEESMLATLTAMGADEPSPLRRAGALVVLLTLTLLTAGMVAAGIYRGVSALK